MNPLALAMLSGWLRSLQNMARTTVDRLRRVKGLARYILEYPQGEREFDMEGAEAPDLYDQHVHSDSDWAGCRATRRSTSGGVMLIRGSATDA